MDASLSVLSHADGSCELWQKGRGRILCGVTGPGDVSSSRRIFDRANVFFSINRLTTRNREEIVALVRTPSSVSSASSSTPPVQPIDHFIRFVVENAIDLSAYPRSCIQICTQELEVVDPGDAFHLNGLCLALIDSGIRMRHIFAAVTVCLQSEDDSQSEMAVDPTQAEANAGRALFTLVFKPSVILAGKLIGAHATGQFTMDEYKKAVDLAERHCLSVFDFYRRKAQEKFIYYVSRTIA